MWDWAKIETVLLDMDGTLLDKHYDDYFWERYVPEIYARQNGLNAEEAGKKLLDIYKAKEGTLDWTDLDYWSEQLGLDIPALKIKIDHLIQIHPYVIDFLEFLAKSSKRVYLVTNAHSKTLGIKMKKTALNGYFDRIICAAEVGRPKEDASFWPGLKKIIPFSRETTMLAEDTEKVLHSAQTYGIKHLIYVARPSSRKGIKKSACFPSIVYFNELLEPR
jgi:putative hydrolase of the HAD superfamily